MWIFNFVQLTPRVYIGDVHQDIQKLRVIDKVKASVAAIRRKRREMSGANHDNNDDDDDDKALLLLLASLN